MDRVIRAIQEVHEQFKARGNWGHSGRPGKIGGSSPKGGGGSSMSGLSNVKTHETKHGYKVRVGETAGGFGYQFREPHGDYDSGVVGGFPDRKLAKAAGSNAANNHWSDVKANMMAKLSRESVEQGYGPIRGWHY